MMIAAAVFGAAMMQASPAADRNAGRGPRPAEVTVTAHRRDLDRTLSDVRAVTADYAGQITRFEVAVCPVVIGSPSAQAEVVTARIRDVARRSGVTVAPPGCEPNLVTAVAEDGAGFVQALRRKHAGLFESLSLHEAERLQASPGPAWT